MWLFSSFEMIELCLDSLFVVRYLVFECFWSDVSSCDSKNVSPFLARIALGLGWGFSSKGLLREVRASFEKRLPPSLLMLPEGVNPGKFLTKL